MSKDNREECPDCKGTGSGRMRTYEAFSSPIPCKKCNGTGEVTIDSGVDANGWFSAEGINKPDNGRAVLVFDGHKKIASIGKFNGEGLPFEWTTIHDDSLNNFIVTHWKPIKPPINY